MNEAGKIDTDLLRDQGAVQWKVELAIKILKSTTASIQHISERLSAGSMSNFAALINKRVRLP
jgi:hypothetical protein